MLGFVQGAVIGKSPETSQVIVLAGSVGYEVFVPKRYCEVLELQQSVSLWLQSVVREDAFHLFGFQTELEKNFFRLLTSVSGLGPKSSLALLGELGPTALANAILNADAASLSAVPGIGKKTAEKILLELRPKIEKWAWLSKLERSEKAQSSSKNSSAPQTTLREDLTSALSNLGYSPTQIKSAIESIDDKSDFTEALRQCLKGLSVLSFRSGPQNANEPSVTNA